MNDTAEKFKRIEAVRKTLETIKDKRAKLSGEINGSRKRLEELKKECKEKYEVEIETLPELIKQLEAESEESLKKAEEILNITEC